MLDILGQRFVALEARATGQTAIAPGLELIEDAQVGLAGAAQGRIATNELNRVARQQGNIDRPRWRPWPSGLEQGGMAGRRSPSPRRVPGAPALTMIPPRAVSLPPGKGDGPAPLSRAAKRRLRDKARRVRFAADPARAPGPPVMDVLHRSRSLFRRTRDPWGPAPRGPPTPNTDRAGGRRVAVTDQAEVWNIDHQAPAADV